MESCSRGPCQLAKGLHGTTESGKTSVIFSVVSSHACLIPRSSRSHYSTSPSPTSDARAPPHCAHLNTQRHVHFMERPPTHPCSALMTVFSRGLLVYLLSKLNTYSVSHLKVTL